MAATKPNPDSWKSLPGVRAVLIDDAGRVLLLRRPDKEPFYGGHWNLPGGGKDPGESFAEGACRELEEETGLAAHTEGIVYPYTFPGGSGRAYLFRHPEGELRTPRREVAEAAWFELDQLPSPMMPNTAEIIAALAGTRHGPSMAELDVTATRLAIERDVAESFAAWLKPWVKAIAAERGWSLDGERLAKAIGETYTPEDADAALRAIAQERSWREQGIPAYRGTDEEGEALSFATLERAAKLGRAEAAKAILSDAKAGVLPPTRSQGYRDATTARLRSLARKNVRLVRATTEKALAKLAADAEAANVATLLAKLYDLSRAENIAINTVAGGYVRGVANVLREHGYRHVYSRTMADERVCKVCRPNEGRRWTLLQFLSTYPLHPRCRCAPHPHPTSDLAPLAFRPTQTAKVLLKSMQIPTSFVAAHAIATLKAACEPAPLAQDPTAGALSVLAKAIAPRKADKKAKADKKPARMPDHDAPPFQAPSVAQLDPGNPEHLLAMGRAIHAHAQNFPKGHPARAHALKQYEHVRQEVEEWHRKRNGGDVKLPAAPDWVMGGAAHLTNPREFSLAMHQAGDRDQLLELAHYFDAYHTLNKKHGADWDAVWQAIKVGIQNRGVAPGQQANDGGQAIDPDQAADGPPQPGKGKESDGGAPDPAAATSPSGPDASPAPATGFGKTPMPVKTASLPGEADAPAAGQE